MKDVGMPNVSKKLALVFWPKKLINLLKSGLPCLTVGQNRLFLISPTKRFIIVILSVIWGKVVVKLSGIAHLPLTMK